MKNLHELLIQAPDFAVAEQKAQRFFAKNFLVRYEEAHVLAEDSRSARDPDFWERLIAGQTENRRRAAELVSELEEAGLSNLSRLQDLHQGYESKILHTLSHLLDGFFGVDSYFFNLVDDSHWVPESRQRLIRDEPGGYWLLQVAVRTGTSDDDPFADLRRQAKNL